MIVFVTVVHAIHHARNVVVLIDMIPKPNVHGVERMRHAALRQESRSTSAAGTAPAAWTLHLRGLPHREALHQFVGWLEVVAD